jgi:hypothetical protein
MSDLKDLTFFASNGSWRDTPSNYHKGQDWFRRRFSHRKPGQLRGEYSPSYFFDPASPNLLFTHNPKMKLLVSLRNPIDRLYATYFHRDKYVSIPGTFEEFLGQNLQYMETGFYYTHLSRYLRHFPLETIHLMLFEDIQDYPKAVLQSLYRFLGVREDFDPPTMERKVNPRGQPRMRFLRDVLFYGNLIFERGPLLWRLKERLRRWGVGRFYEWLFQKNLKGINIPPMKRETRSRLVTFYSEENKRLGELLDRDLTHWNR